LGFQKKYGFWKNIVSLRGKFCSMKRIFAAWLMDIAKYVVTVLLLSTILSDISGFASGWLLYVITFSLVLIVVFVGFMLYKSADIDDKKKV